MIDFLFKKKIAEDIFEDLQDTYEFSKNHDQRKEKDDFKKNMIKIMIK